MESSARFFPPSNRKATVFFCMTILCVVIFLFSIPRRSMFLDIFFVILISFTILL